MTSVRAMVLAPQTTYVTVEELPGRIAEALYPEAADQMTVSYLRKAERLPGGADGPAEELQPQDWEELREAWAYLPPYRDGIGQSTWLAYRAAFNLFCPHLCWKPVPLWKGGPMGNALLRASAEEEHRRYLHESVQRGELLTRNHALIPLPALHGSLPDARILVADLATYCAKFSVEVRVEEFKTPSLPGVAVGSFAKDLAAQLGMLFGQFWNRRSVNDDLRFSVRSGRGEKEILDAIRTMAAQGQVALTMDSGEPVARLASNIEDKFRLSSEDANKVVETIVGVEALSVQYRRQELEQDAAGRLTLSQLITFLSMKTGWEHKRWESVVVDAVKTKQLPLRNPRNFTDLLPYPIPEQIETYDEQVTIADADAWLDLHSEWNVSFRLTTRATVGLDEEAVTSQQVETTDVGGNEAWKAEALRLADIVALEQWNRGERQITARGVARQVAKRLERSREYWGKKGPRDPNTIRTYALKGWRFDPPCGSNGPNGS